MERTIPDKTWAPLAQSLNVSVAALRAVAAVESAGDGFLLAPPELPKILFEGHAFHRLTQGRFDTAHPTLSYPKWTKQFYSKTGAGEWHRLNAACALDRRAALQSASWGMFQIMGFNYALCGHTDVEAFVAQQKAGAAEQLECFVRFISRDIFLSALRERRWAAFARAYNGPGDKLNQYDTKLAAAYAVFAKPQAEPSAAAMKKMKPSNPGRRDFEPVPQQRQRPQRRPVKADRVDLRDWEYRPNIALAPPAVLMPKDPRIEANQGDTNACTGFSLATVIEYLLDRSAAGRADLRLMLYSMARRYDEWAEQRHKDEGSSLRGALKGWARHGASAPSSGTARHAAGQERLRKTGGSTASTRPLGAYYRMSLEIVPTCMCALMESGALYASAFTHGGWDALSTTRARSADRA